MRWLWTLGMTTKVAVASKYKNTEAWYPQRSGHSQKVKNCTKIAQSKVSRSHYCAINFCISEAAITSEVNMGLATCRLIQSIGVKITVEFWIKTSLNLLDRIHL